MERYSAPHHIPVASLCELQSAAVEGLASKLMFSDYDLDLEVFRICD